jgi:hypothetical protein
MAKGAPKSTAGTLPKNPSTGSATNPSTGSAPAQPAPPKTTGAVAPAPKPAPGQKQAAGQPADIGDICLLPDIARFAH